MQTEPLYLDKEAERTGKGELSPEEISSRHLPGQCHLRGGCQEKLLRLRRWETLTGIQMQMLTNGMEVKSAAFFL